MRFNIATERDVFIAYDDYHPICGKSYFYKDAKPPQGFDKITVLIPMYNETIKEFKRTLQDLHTCVVEMNKIGGGYVHILVILDGVKAMHSSIKEYLKEMFPQVSINIDNIGKTEKSVETYVIQKLKGEEATYVKIDDDKSLKISVLIKLDNRRKHNSHAWFLETFAQEMDSDYTFLTDCGTRFDEKCLINLYRGIENDVNCSAISGRQRVMNTAQQESNDTFRGFMYRSMQRFDYEASLASYVGAFSTFGMLPVIPGPCGLYRFSAICNFKKRQELREQYEEMSKDIVSAAVIANAENSNNDNDEHIDAIDFYIKTVALNPDETGMLLGSLLLAEDRILSYAAVLKTEKRFHTKYEPNACFYFEAETNPTTLLQQRRRWINGTLAGYLWLLQRISLLYNSKVNLYNKIILTILIVSQFMMFCVMSIGTAILTVAIRFPLMVSFGVPRLYVEIIIGLYVALYILFVFLHSSPTRKAPKLNTVLFDIMTLCNVGVACIMMYGFVQNLMNYKLIANVVVIGFNMFMPFILAGLHDWKSLMYMFGSVIQYILLLPTFTVSLSVYSFSRLWELTWGNRPSDRLVTLKQQKTEEELLAIKVKLQTHAQTVAWFLVILNLFAICLFAWLQGQDLFIIVLQLFIFIWSSLQMLCSLFYFVVRMFVETYMFLKRIVIAHSTSRKKMDIMQKSESTQHFIEIVDRVNSDLNTRSST
jgi:cellulose synthase/poly-beta-1,6-N-acetylglucosamine synthase-like glycosyltransferase